MFTHRALRLAHYLIRSDCGVALRQRGTRQLHTQPDAHHRARRTLRVAIPLAGVGLAAATLPYVLPSATAETEVDPSASTSTLSRIPTTSLLRTYLVYTLCSFPSLVDRSTSILAATINIPGISTIIRETFFAQFVGGETVAECIPLMKKLRAEDDIGSLLAYSVEVEEHYAGSGGKPAYNHAAEEGAGQEERNEHVEETIRAIEQSGAFEREMAMTTGVSGGTWVAVKITGLSPDPELLHRASNTLLRLRSSLPAVSKSTNISPLAPAYPCTPTSLDSQILSRPDCYPTSTAAGLISLPRTAIASGGVLEGEEGIREGDLEELRKLWNQLRRIGEAAKRNGIRIVMDAEHSWYQPLIDGYTLMLSQEFNKMPSGKGEATEGPLPLIYGTYQAYLRRLPEHLDAALAHAQDNNYALGIKLVRGAYHVQERSRWIEEGRIKFGADPVWEDKPATDKAYNAAIAKIVDQVASTTGPRVGVLFGTHNIESCKLIVEQLKKSGAVKELPDGKLRPEAGIRGRVCIGQLYGMSDNLTESVAAKFEKGGLPMVLKYIPYARLDQAIPYLGRRATENKSLLIGTMENGGGAPAERARAWGEVKRRLSF